jgi:hypothetical protein
MRWQSKRSITPKLTAFVKIKTRSMWPFHQSADDLLHHPLNAAISGRTDALQCTASPWKRGLHGHEVGISRQETGEESSKGLSPMPDIVQHIDPEREVKMFSRLGVQNLKNQGKLTLLPSTQSRKYVHKYPLCPRVAQLVKGCSKQSTNTCGTANGLLHSSKSLLSQHFDAACQSFSPSKLTWIGVILWGV